MALVLLVLFTAFVLITALSDDQPFSAADSQIATQSNTESVSTSTTHDLMPATIPVDSTAVVENRTVTRGDGETMEQTITFQSQLAAPAIAREYQTWMADNGYTVADERIGQKAASLKAVNGSRALVVLISHFTNSGLSNVEIINFAHDRS